MCIWVTGVSHVYVCVELHKYVCVCIRMGINKSCKVLRTQVQLSYFPRTGTTYSFHMSPIPRPKNPESQKLPPTLTEGSSRPPHWSTSTRFVHYFPVLGLFFRGRTVQVRYDPDLLHKQRVLVWVYSGGSERIYPSESQFLLFRLL